MDPLSKLTLLKDSTNHPTNPHSIYKMPIQTDQAYIRVNGLFMFSRPFRTDMGLIFEIPKGYSKAALTGNRDGFSGLT
jgi:hypothetical protein